MLQFESIYSQNFMSIGPDGVKFQLDANLVTVVVGTNGSGKSTGLIDATYYCLFGKPFRDDFKIGDLMNDETKKEMLTVCKFKNNGHSWEVKRGRKHAIEFEIYKDGTLQKVPSDLKVYQRYLEETVLGFDSETFKQVIILGSSAYVPFMKLDTPGRRKVVEDLLAIRIFSFMNEVAKEDAKEIKAKSEAASHTLDLAKQSVTLNEQKLCGLEQQAKTNVDANHKQIAGNSARIDELTAEVEKINKEISELNATITDASELKVEYQSCETKVRECNTGIAASIRSAKFYKENTSCPECKQAIAEDFRATKLAEFKAQHDEAQAEIKKTQEHQSTVRDRLLEIKEVMTKVQQLSVKGQQLASEISSLQMTNQHLLSEIQRQSGASDAHMTQARAELDASKEKLVKAESEIAQIRKDGLHIKAALDLLKDDKIKGDVIRQNIPLINSEIQKNLDILEFPATFALDEKFKESITLNDKKRSYAALSEGQKLRVDLAILFAWRKIAATKSSADSSLIVFDEIGSSSLDAAGMSLFQKLVDAHNKDSNVFQITHDQRVASEYPHVVEVSLKGKFTTVKEINS